jgi:hypothetical protein
MENNIVFVYYKDNKINVLDFEKAKTLTSEGTPQAVDNYYSPDD